MNAKTFVWIHTYYVQTLQVLYERMAAREVWLHQRQTKAATMKAQVRRRGGSFVSGSCWGLWQRAPRQSSSSPLQVPRGGGGGGPDSPPHPAPPLTHSSTFLRTLQGASEEVVVETLTAPFLSHSSTLPLFPTLQGASEEVVAEALTAPSDDEVPALTDKEEQERVELLESGFGSWTR